MTDGDNAIGAGPQETGTLVEMDTEEDARGWYVYGIVRAGTEQPDLVGVDDQPVRVLEHGAVAAVVAAVGLDQARAARADVVAHSTVLDAFAGRGPVIPVRFGSVLESSDAVVAELLAPDHDRFVALLDDLAGRAQFNLRARYDEAAVLAEVVADDPEIGRLREITRDQPEEAVYADKVRLGELVARSLETKREADTQILLDLLLPHTAAYHLREGGALEDLADVAFLVNDEQREAFEDAAESAAEAFHPRARLRLLGPLAPYDFVAEQ